MKIIAALLLTLATTCVWADTITGRVVGVSDGDTITVLDATNQQIKRGLAWHYKKYQNEQPLDDRLAYARAEVAARAAKIGLWSDSSPTPPWDWRHSRKH